MQLNTSEAILLDVVDLADYDRIVAFLTPDQGQVKGVAKGARRKHSRFAGQLQPLAKVEATWMAKSGRELVRLSGVDLIRSAEALNHDLETLLVGGYLADHMIEFAQENEDSRKLYRLLDATVEGLLGGVGVALATRYFEIWMLRLAGIFPEPVDCPRCGGSVLERGAALPHGEMTLVCRECHPGGEDEAVSTEVLETIVRTRFQGLTEMAETPPGPEALRGVEAICRTVRRAFLQRELRSYRVLQQALA